MQAVVAVPRGERRAVAAYLLERSSVPCAVRLVPHDGRPGDSLRAGSGGTHRPRLSGLADPLLQELTLSQLIGTRGFLKEPTQQHDPTHRGQALSCFPAGERSQIQLKMLGQAFLFPMPLLAQCFERHWKLCLIA